MPEEQVGIQDLVLIHVSEKPATYARVEAIDADVKPGWWRVRLLILTVPLQLVVWILEREQIDGKPFTMGGTPVRIERIVPPETSAEGPGEPPPRDMPGGSDEKMIPLRDKKRGR